MEKGTLILICGLIGAGKTTLAKKLAEERNAVRLCPDDWTLAILKDQKNVPERDRVHDAVEKQLWKHAQNILELGISVILENGFWAETERNGYRDYAKEHGIKVELHFVDAPYETLWRRVEARNSEASELFVTREEVEAAIKVFEPPTIEEGAGYNYFHHYLY